MKTKKIITLLLAIVVLACSFHTITAFAQNETSEEEQLKDLAAIYLMSHYYSFIDETHYEEIYETVYDRIAFIAKDNGYHIFSSAGLLFSQPAHQAQKIGGYIFFQVNNDAFYTVNTETVSLLIDAYHYGQVNITKIANQIQPAELMKKDNFNTVTMLGDCDFDRTLTIKDATILQRVISGLEQENQFMNFGTLNFSGSAYDYNQDGSVDIKDVTTIQKVLADLLLLYPDQREPITDPTSSCVIEPSEDTTNSEPASSSVSDPSEDTTDSQPASSSVTESSEDTTELGSTVPWGTDPSEVYTTEEPTMSATSSPETTDPTAEVVPGDSFEFPEDDF